MRFLFATHVLRGYPLREPPLPDPAHRRTLFAWAKRQGFDGVEVGSWWLDVCNVAPSVVASLGHELRDHGLALGGFNLLRKNVTHPSVREASRRDILAAIERAGEVSARFVSVSLSTAPCLFGRSEDDARGLSFSPGGSRSAGPGEIEEAALFLREAAAHAAVCGVELALELHHCSLADTSSTIARLIELADYPTLRPNPDLGNVYWAYGQPEEEWSEALRRLAPMARVWHVKNVQRVWSPETGRSRFIQAALDAGDIDYRWALGQMLACGFDGDICIEGGGPGDFLALAAHGLGYLRGLLADHTADGGLLVQ